MNTHPLASGLLACLEGCPAAANVFKPDPA